MRPSTSPRLWRYSPSQQGAYAPRSPRRRETEHPVLLRRRLGPLRLVLRRARREADRQQRRQDAEHRRGCEPRGAVPQRVRAGPVVVRRAAVRCSAVGTSSTPGAARSSTERCGTTRSRRSRSCSVTAGTTSAKWRKCGVPARPRTRPSASRNTRSSSPGWASTTSPNRRRKRSRTGRPLLKLAHCSRKWKVTSARSGSARRKETILLLVRPDHRSPEVGQGVRKSAVEHRPRFAEVQDAEIPTDVPEVREDFADYLGEAQAYDAYIGVLLKQLKDAGELDNTIVVISGDHGMPGVPGASATSTTSAPGSRSSRQGRGCRAARGRRHREPHGPRARRFSKSVA